MERGKGAGNSAAAPLTTALCNIVPCPLCLWVPHVIFLPCLDAHFMQPTPPQPTQPFPTITPPSPPTISTHTRPPRLAPPATDLLRRGPNLVQLYLLCSVQCGALTNLQYRRGGRHGLCNTVPEGAEMLLLDLLPRRLGWRVGAPTLSIHCAIPHCCRSWPHGPCSYC